MYHITLELFSSVQFSSVIQSCPTLCDPMNHSTPGLPVHHQLLEFTQTHVHRVGDAIQPSHPLSSPSPPAPNPSQHQDLFQRVSSSHEVAKVLEFQLQHQSFQWTSRTDLLLLCYYLVLIANDIALHCSADGKHWRDTDDFHETLEIHFFNEDKMPWICEMLHRAFAELEGCSRWWQNNKCYQWPVSNARKIISRWFFRYL